MRLQEVTDKEWQLFPQYLKSLKYKKGFAFKVEKENRTVLTWCFYKQRKGRLF